MFRHSTAAQLLCKTLKASSKIVRSWVRLTRSISFDINKIISCNNDKLLGTFLGPDPATELVKVND